MTRAALERLADDCMTLAAAGPDSLLRAKACVALINASETLRALAQEAAGDGETLCRQLRIGSEHAEQLRKLHRAAELLCEALSLPESEASSLAAHWFDQRGIARIGGIVPNKTITRREDAEIFAAKHDGTVVGRAPTFRDGVEADGWKPIASAPNDDGAGRMIEIIIGGGTYYDSSETYPSDYPLKSWALACWDGHGWRGENSGGHDEFYYHKPTHWLPKSFIPTPPVAAGSERDDG